MNVYETLPEDMFDVHVQCTCIERVNVYFVVHACSVIACKCIGVYVHINRTFPHPHMYMYMCAPVNQIRITHDTFLL